MKKTFIAAAVAVMPLAASAATVNIDTFSVDEALIETTADAVTSATTSNGSGFDRTITAMSDSSAADDSSVTGVEVQIVNSELRISSTIGGFGSYVLNYEANAGAIDMTAGGANDVFRLSRLTDTPMDISVSVNGGADVDFVSIGGGVYEVKFSDIAGGVDAVTSLDFTLEDASDIGGTDAVIRFIGATTAVPLPAGGALLLAGLGAFGVAARRRK